MNALEDWVASAPEKSQASFRSVVHIILNGISSHHELRPQMIMKGGILMAIAYHTGRHTKDIDFSTTALYKEFEAGQDAFIRRLDDAIKLSAAQLPYGIACAIQRHEIRPAKEGNYQTLHMNVGYAFRANANAMRQLAAKQAGSVVQIDYSFNELVGDIGILDAGGSAELQTYGVLTLIAEKLRALIQQGDGPGGRRNISSRGQDIFDLFSLLSSAPPSWEQQTHLLPLLIDKAKSRDLQITRTSMADQRIRDRCAERYVQLVNEIEGELPDFDIAFDTVKHFYESLPWPKEKRPR